jgi:O-antigen/teichoic acid export membrane protein
MLMKLMGLLDAALADPRSGFLGWCFYYVFGAAGFAVMAACSGAVGALTSRIALLGWVKFLKKLQQSRCAHQWTEIQGHRSHDIGLVVDQCSLCGATRNELR